MNKPLLCREKVKRKCVTNIYLLKFLVKKKEMRMCVKQAFNYICERYI